MRKSVVVTQVTLRIPHYGRASVLAYQLCAPLLVLRVELCLGFRCFFLDKICEKLGSHGESMEVDGPGASVDVLVSNCKFDMRLRMADSAWKQVTGGGLPLLCSPVRSSISLEMCSCSRINPGFK